MVEHTAVNRGVVGSSPTRGVFVLQKHLVADVAQLAEQLICNQQVIGSSPIIGFEYFALRYNRISRGGAVW